MRHRAAALRRVHAVTYDIRSKITPLPKRLLVDTNVWLFAHYSPFSLGARQEAAATYADFLARCIDEGCELLRSPFMLPEVTHVIERAEADAAKERGLNMGLKQMRWEPNHRLKVIAEVITTWKQIEIISEWSPGLSVDGKAAKQMLIDFRNLKIDGYDLLIVQEALKEGELPILTDDFDYLSVPTMTVYTANVRAVEAAKRSEKLRQ